MPLRNNLPDPGVYVQETPHGYIRGIPVRRIVVPQFEINRPNANGDILPSIDEIVAAQPMVAPTRSILFWDPNTGIIPADKELDCKGIIVDEPKQPIPSKSRWELILESNNE